MHSLPDEELPSALHFPLIQDPVQSSLLRQQSLKTPFPFFWPFKLLLFAQGGVEVEDVVEVVEVVEVMVIVVEVFLVVVEVEVEVFLEVVVE